LDCKSILVMREEFIANLWDYEYLLPSIFSNHFRIKQLSKDQVKEVVVQTLSTLATQNRLAVVEKGMVANTILDKMGNTGIELTYLQVFLDRLFRLAKREQGIPVFNAETIEEMGTFEDIIDDFLDEQLTQLEQQLKLKQKGIPLKILGSMISDERTKKVLQIDDMEAIRQKFNLTKEEMDACLKAFEKMRILNRYES